MSEELKACPFCGGAACGPLDSEGWESVIKAGHDPAIFCETCALAPTLYGSNLEQNTRDEAVRVWNQRVTNNDTNNSKTEGKC